VRTDAQYDGPGQPCNADRRGHLVRVSIPTLDTARLVLTLPDATAAEEVSAYFRDNRAHLDPFEPLRPPEWYTTGFWRRQLEENRSEYREGRSARFILRDRAAPAGAVQGCVNLTRMVGGAMQSCCLGYSLDRRREGQGLMHEALVAALRFAFDDLGLHRVEAAYLPENARSARLLGRLGFEIVGTARDYLLIQGRWRDHVVTSLLNPAHA